MFVTSSQFNCSDNASLHSLCSYRLRSFLNTTRTANSSLSSPHTPSTRLHRAFPFSISHLRLITW